jgi:hypothetical protein
MEYGVNRQLEAAADAFLRSHGEEPPTLRSWDEELQVARRAALKARRGVA